jgi:hypothetical protein
LGGHRRRADGAAVELVAETEEEKVWVIQVGGVSIRPDVWSRLEQIWPDLP